MNTEGKPRWMRSNRYQSRFFLGLPEAGIPYLAEAELNVGRIHNRHIHHELQLLWVLRGEMAMEIGPVTHELPEGSCCIIPPEQVHRVVPAVNFPAPVSVRDESVGGHQRGADTPGGECASRAVVLDLRLTDEASSPLVSFLRDLGGGQGLPGPVLSGPLAGIVEAVRQVEAAAAGDGPTRRARVLAGVWNLLGELAAAHARAAPAPRPDPAPDARGDDARFLAAEQFMRDHLADPIGVPDVAAAAGLSRSQLSRVCMAVRGAGPATRLRQLRVERAGELLRTTTLSIKEIAHVCGFASQNHFSRVFFDSTGKRPSQARQGG